MILLEIHWTDTDHTTESIYRDRVEALAIVPYLLKMTRVKFVREIKIDVGVLLQTHLPQEALCAPSPVQ